MNKILNALIGQFLEESLEFLKETAEDTEDEKKRAKLREGSIDVEYRVIEDEIEK